MKYRLVTSLLLMAVLAGLYLWWVQPDDYGTGQDATPVTGAVPAPAPALPVRIY